MHTTSAAARCVRFILSCCWSLDSAAAAFRTFLFGEEKHCDPAASRLSCICKSNCAEARGQTSLRGENGTDQTKVELVLAPKSRSILQASSAVARLPRSCDADYYPPIHCSQCSPALPSFSREAAHKSTSPQSEPAIIITIEKLRPLNDLLTTVS